MRTILHVVVVGFHHKKGCQVEYVFPPLGEGNVEESLPSQWKNLPTLALPDGAHNVQQDFTYFLLPSLDSTNKVVYGISCYRQIASETLISRSSEVTRSTVQKSVCVISTLPLFGVLKAKLQLITHAYFNEKDFSKVDVLSQMYANLCDMFDNEDLVDGQAASMDIPLRSVLLTFRHRILLLFKLFLLERKVLFYMFPAQCLGDTLISLISLFPRLLEEGLDESNGQLKWRDPSPCREAVDVEEERGEEDKEERAEEREGEEEKRRQWLQSLGEDPLLAKKDSFGFPLSIFTLGNQFNPYIGLSMIDGLRSTKTRGFVVGATNALFMQRRELADVIVTVDGEGVGCVDIIDGNLRKALNLSSADLRFTDFLIKNVEGSRDEAPEYEGSNEWIRDQFRAYLLSLGASARSDLATATLDFGPAFLSQWKDTVNYARWIDQGKHEDLVSVVPGHAYSGQLGVYDVMLRVEHSVGGSEHARKALSALSSTGKSLGEKGGKMKSNITSWFKGVTGQVERTECEEAKEATVSDDVTPETK